MINFIKCLYVIISNIVRYAFYQEYEHLIELPLGILYKAIMQGKKSIWWQKLLFKYWIDKVLRLFSEKAYTKLFT